MPCPTLFEILQTRDVFKEWFDDAVCEILDLGEVPDECLPAARRVAAERVRKADEIMGVLCRQLARWADLVPEDCPTLDGLESELRLAAELTPAPDPEAERADYNRKLRLVSEQMDAA